jgi:hypothetical protein
MNFKYFIILIVSFDCPVKIKRKEARQQHVCYISSLDTHPQQHFGRNRREKTAQQLTDTFGLPPVTQQHLKRLKRKKHIFSKFSSFIHRKNIRPNKKFVGYWAVDLRRNKKNLFSKILYSFLNDG